MDKEKLTELEKIDNQIKELKNKRPKEIILPLFYYKIYKKGWFILFIGAIMNFLVMQSNNGKMPVLNVYNETIFITSKHILVTSSNFNNIKFFPFIDMWNIKIAMISLGDIFLFIGAILIISGELSLLKYLYLNYRIKKLEKKKEMMSK